MYPASLCSNPACSGPGRNPEKDRAHGGRELIASSNGAFVLQGHEETIVVIKDGTERTGKDVQARQNQAGGQRRERSASRHLTVSQFSFFRTVFKDVWFSVTMKFVWHARRTTQSSAEKRGGKWEHFTYPPTPLSCRGSCSHVEASRHVSFRAAGSVCQRLWFHISCCCLSFPSRPWRLLPLTASQNFPFWINSSLCNRMR